MSGIASLLLGFALALLATAGPLLLCLPAGGDPACVLPALTGLIAGMVAVAWLPMPRRANASHRTIAGLCGFIALACAAPAGLRPVAAWLWLLPQNSARAGFIGAAAVATLGVLGGALFALAGRVGALAGPLATSRNLALLLGGAALGFPAAPTLAYDLLGLPGALYGVAVLAAVATALLASRPKSSAAAAPLPPAPRPWGARPLLAALAGLGIGLIVTVGSWRLDPGGTAAARHDLLGLLALAAGGAALLPRALRACGCQPLAALLVAGPVAILAGPALALGWPGQGGTDPPVMALEIALALVFVCASLGAAMPACDDRAAPRRGHAVVAIAVVAALAVRLGPIEPGAAARFCCDLGLVLGTAGTLAIRSRGQPSLRPHRVAAGLLVLIALWLARRDAVLDDSTVRLAAFEADGTPTIARRSADHTFAISRSGSIARDETAEPRALRRLLFIGLSLGEQAPAHLLVLGAHGLPLVRALVEIQTAPVTWVTPNRGEVNSAFADPDLIGAAHLTVIHAGERAFLERTTERFDFMALPPPRDRERHGLLLTDEMHALIRSRLTQGGLVVHVHDIGRLSARALERRVLQPLLGSCQELLLFLDHPRNPRPLLGAISAAQPIRMLPDQIAARLAQLGQQPIAREALRVADLDVRGVIQCFVMDRDLLRLFVRGRKNTDERPWLAAAARPDQPFETGAMEWLLLRRSSPGARLVLHPLDAIHAPVAYAISGKVKYDFQAGTRLFAAAFETRRPGQAWRDPEDPTHPDDDLNASFAGTTLSPDLGVARGPVDRAINDRISRRHLDAAAELSKRLAQLEPTRRDLDLLVARLRERSGATAAAAAAYRTLLVKDPTDAAASGELGLLLAGAGSEVRELARPYLQQAAGAGVLSQPLLDQVRLALVFLDGDWRSVQTLLAGPGLVRVSTPFTNYLRARVAARDALDP